VCSGVHLKNFIYFSILTAKKCGGFSLQMRRFCLLILISMVILLSSILSQTIIIPIGTSYYYRNYLFLCFLFLSSAPSCSYLFRMSVGSGRMFCLLHQLASRRLCCLRLHFSKESNCWHSLTKLYLFRVSLICQPSQQKDTRDRQLSMVVLMVNGDQLQSVTFW